MAKITEKNGDIFESGLQTLVNTVNCVGVMGKGIALEFRRRYPEMYKAYRKKCKNNQLQPGLLYLWKDSDPWILNFPTKNHWKYPSKLEYIESGLQKFADSFQFKSISSIAFPELGTNQGGLKWEDVQKLMYKYLEPLPNLEVEIYHYDPMQKDSQFDRFIQKVHRFDVPDYVNYLKITKKQARIICNSVSSGQLRNMHDIQNLDGIGERTLQKIFDFIKTAHSKRLVTVSESRPKLDIDHG